MRLNMKSTKWAAVAVLWIGRVSPAFGGSVTRPGDTIGAASGTPVSPGVYVANTVTYECRDTNPKETCALVDVPLVAWSTPWKIAGGRLQLSAAPIVPVRLSIDDTVDFDGLFGSYAGTQLAGDLGKDWGVSYLLGVYTEGNSSVAYSSASLNQRFGVSYTGNGWNLTANAIWGVQFGSVTSEPQVSPCPVTAAHPRNGCNPDFLNIDMTATRRFGRWELGAVALYSTDLNEPIPEYEKQSQFAAGGLVGYWWDRAVVQAYVTSNVHENNYGGSAISGNLRVIFALGKPPARPIAQ